MARRLPPIARYSRGYDGISSCRLRWGVALGLVSSESWRRSSGGGRGLGMEAKAERPNDLQDRGKLRAPIAAQRLVERLAGQSCLLGELGHAASAGDHAQRVGDLVGVAIRESAVEIGEHRFGTIQIGSWVERPGLDGHFTPPLPASGPR